MRFTDQELEQQEKDCADMARIEVEMSSVDFQDFSDSGSELNR